MDTERNFLEQLVAAEAHYVAPLRETGQLSAAFFDGFVELRGLRNHHSALLGRLEEAWSVEASRVIVRRIGDSGGAESSPSRVSAVASVSSSSPPGSNSRSIDTRPFVKVLSQFVADRMTQLRYVWWHHCTVEVRQEGRHVAAHLFAHAKQSQKDRSIFSRSTENGPASP